MNLSDAYYEQKFENEFLRAKAARADMTAAFAWYEDRRAGLGGCCIRDLRSH